MKLKTIVNKVTDGSITSITLEVYNEKNVLEMDFSIEYGIAVVDEARVLCEKPNEPLKLIKKELKDRGISTIKYKNNASSVDEFVLS